MLSAFVVLAVASMLVVVESGRCKDSYDVFIWANHNNVDGYWKSFNWDVITTIGFFGSLDEGQLIGLREYAHERGVKLVKGVGADDEQINNATYRSEIIDGMVNQAISEGYDGVNIDHEGNNPKTLEGWTSFAIETANAFHERIPGSEVSADVGIYPEYEFRNLTFDYTRMGEALDYLFIMGYDGEFWDNVQCINPKTSPECSNACAPYSVVVYGIESYINKYKIAPEKLYLGLPWYGIKYEFVHGVPFQIGQISYQDVMNVKKSHRNATVTFDDRSKTQILDCGGFCNPTPIKNEAFYSQIWYDDSTSLAYKYQLAKSYKLKGVGMWQASDLDYTSTINKLDTKAMWDAICQ